MNLDQFITKYNNKIVDFDGAYGGQCVDLYRQYVKEVLNVPQSPPVAGAKDIWNTYLPAHFDRFNNTPLGVPQKGDIIIWGSKYGPYGHVGVYVSGNVLNFTSFDQNDPVGSRCHLQKHNYNGVLGWLRAKPVNLTPEQKESKIRGILGEQISASEHLKKIDAVIHG